MNKITLMNVIMTLKEREREKKKGESERNWISKRNFEFP